LATITGSTTSGCNSWCVIPATTASMMATLESMPVFRAPIEKSSATASSCDAMIAGSISCTARTPTVFCAVTAVITLSP